MEGEDSIDVCIKESSWKLISQIANEILPQLRRGASIEAQSRIDTRVVFGQIEKFIDGRYAVHNSFDSITIVAKLGFDLRRVHLS